MDSEKKTLSWQEALPEIYRLAAEDDTFRALCLTDFRQAFARVGVATLPEGLRIRFVNRPEELVFVLPPPVSGEMSDDDLDAVAGGAPSVWGGGMPSVWAAPSGPSVPHVGPALPNSTPYSIYGYGGPYAPPPATGAPPLLPPGGPPPGY